MNPVVGNRITSTVEFRDAVTNVLTDPDTVTFKTRSPAGTEATLTVGAGVTKLATGRYRASFLGNAAGDWIARWVGSGTLDAATEDTISIEPSAFTTP